MEQQVTQFVQAILIASDPSQGSLHHQALEYISSIQQNASDTWKLALAVFVDATPDGARKHPTQARFYALRVLDDFFDNRFDGLDEDTFRTLQQTFLAYVQSEYTYGSAEASATFLRNKFSHTLTLFFLATYVDQWPTFFSDLFALMRPAESSSQAPFNPHVSLLFFHIVLEISGEVADQVIKSARQFNNDRHVRDARVRDAVRERDAARINEAVLTIVAAGADRMTRLRKGELASTSERDLPEAVEVVDWGIRTFGSYAGWVDINLTVTPTTVPLLFSLLSDPSLSIRLATSVALLRIVAKGLKEPSDKLQLIKVLSLGQVLAALEEKTREEQGSRGDEADEGEESYREALGRLLNMLGQELVKLTDDSPTEDIRSEATSLLQQTLPVMLHFMADEYDDTCSTIFPMLQTVLASYKRSRKVSADPIDDQKKGFLASLLAVILRKMKWDEDADLDDVDEDDRAAFELLRKDLRSFMDSVLSIDQDLVTDAVRRQALETLSAYSAGSSVKWTDAELAIYLIYIFGEINKSAGKGRAAFCQAPTLPKDKRKDINYLDYPLTTHGELIFALFESGIAAYPNQTVVMQLFETIARYSDFFKVRKQCIVPALEAMVDTRGLHNPKSSVRSRVFYLFHRFIKESRNEISLDLAGTLLEGIRDTLVIQVELAEIDPNEPQDPLTEATSTPDPQLYLFETVGTLISLFWKSTDQSAALLLSVVRPLLDELSLNLQAVEGASDILPIVKIHHVIMALGNVAKGFPDYPTPVPEGYTFPPLDVFRDVAEAILLSLDAMKVFRPVRDATRFAFARILATTGPEVTRFIPTLMANLLAHFEPTELVDFINFLNLLIHKLQQDIFDVLDQLIGPLNAHITEIMSQPVTGTDDAVSHNDTKRAYLTLLNNTLSSKLPGIFISDRNKDRFEALLQTMLQLAEDVSDPQSQRAAFTFLGRAANVWGHAPSNGSANGDAAGGSQGLPGFERFLYESVLPCAFRVLSSPELNIKDGQVLVVLHEIATLLQTIGKIRGQEAYEFFVSVFLPAQNWPPETAMEFTTNLRDMDAKQFRKYFSDFVRTSRSVS
ncbi:ARM repeat-containing protein [Artomyces pyxidatus]|uniref:ARM repeat-containing protein n=1 Tax=Artomyces pyxidatus TaxID=48021 RepID=A0ACB8TGD9_9AGAM|nr:ARM repeat-containing protein [Artomyces pyxidatus]